MSGAGHLPADLPVETSAPPELRIAIEGGGAFTMHGHEDSLLRGALRAGLAFPYECSVGGCGSCHFELLEGQVQTLWEQAPGLSARERQRGRRLACQSRPLGDCRIRARLDPSAGSALPPRRVPAVLVNRRVIAADLVEFGFQVPSDLRFRAGQYALLAVPGVKGLRAYSMSHGDHGDGLWRFIVRRVPGGAGSSALFEHLSPGDTLALDGPYGHAWLRDGERDLVCVAGGSGLGPMLSVAEGALRQPGARRVHFFLGLRTLADLGAALELQRLKDRRLDSRVVLSEPGGPAGWSGPTGFVHQVVEADLGERLSGFDFYFAGPAPMVEALQQLLVVQHRVPHGQVHFDRFV